MHIGSKVSDVIVMEIEVKGSTEPYQVLLEPYAVVIPGEIFIFTPTRRQFKVISAMIDRFLTNQCRPQLQIFMVFLCYVSVRCGTTAKPASFFNGSE